MENELALRSLGQYGTELVSFLVLGCVDAETLLYLHTLVA
jgi:hypothetical protein